MIIKIIPIHHIIIIYLYVYLWYNDLLLYLYGTFMPACVLVVNSVIMPGNVQCVKRAKSNRQKYAPQSNIIEQIVKSVKI